MAISICSSINAQKKALEKERGKFGRVLAWTMLFISLCSGALGYFVFGEGTMDLIRGYLVQAWLPQW